MSEKRFKFINLGSPYLTYGGIEFDDGDCLDNMTECCEKLNELNNEIEGLYATIETISYANEDLLKQKRNWEKCSDELGELYDEKEQLKSENKRMTDKLNQLALEFLNYNMVTMGKATEISEMCYSDFLKYRKENDNPMELQL